MLGIIIYVIFLISNAFKTYLTSISLEIEKAIILIWSCHSNLEFIDISEWRLATEFWAAFTGEQQSIEGQSRYWPVNSKWKLHKKCLEKFEDQVHFSSSYPISPVSAVCIWQKQIDGYKPIRS